MNIIPPYLATLPAPAIVEELSLDAILAALKERFAETWPDYTAWVESDPAMQLLRVAAYRETLLRARMNAVARANLLAFAGAGDLDHLAAFYGLTRQEGEGDDALRRRTLFRLAGWANAGSADHYRWHAVDAGRGLDLLDVAVDSPRPGGVRIVVMGAAGTPSAELLAAIAARVTASDVRMLTDVVQVVPVTVVPVTVRARLWFYPGAAQGTDTLVENLTSVVAAQRGIGWDLTRSFIMATLHQGGVQRVEVDEPAQDVVIDATQCINLDGVTLTVAGSSF